MTAQVHVGCSSWTSDAWWGRVYPEKLADGERLAWYAQRFNCVEVDSSYYHVPPREMVANWGRKTPPDFRFTMKLTRDLLEAREPADREQLARFLENASSLGPKLGPILLQYTPGVKPGKAQARLTELWDLLDPKLRYAVELRDAAWYRGDTLSWLLRELEQRKIALVWSYLTYVDVPARVTTDQLYVRFIGDHTTVPAETHGEVRVDRSREIALWADRVKAASEEVSSIFVFFNNHFQGFAPASVNLFRTALGLPVVRYEPPVRQSKLTDAP